MDKKAAIAVVFENPEFGKIRTLTDENGEPLFCAKDLCDILGYKKSYNAVYQLVNPHDTLKQGAWVATGLKKDGSEAMRRTLMLYVNESGFYALVLGSKLSTAVKFKNWVTADVLPQIVSRSKHIILKHWSKWNEQQKTRAAILFDKFPKLLEGYSLSMKLTDIFNKKSGPDEARLNLARWYNEVEKFDYMEFNKVLDTFSNHSTTIINYFEERLTNASAESFNAKIKAFRSQLRGVADLKFFMFRLARLYA